MRDDLSSKQHNHEYPQQDPYATREPGDEHRVSPDDHKITKRLRKSGATNSLPRRPVHSCTHAFVGNLLKTILAFEYSFFRQGEQTQGITISSAAYHSASSLKTAHRQKKNGPTISEKEMITSAIRRDTDTDKTDRVSTVRNTQGYDSVFLFESALAPA